MFFSKSLKKLNHRGYDGYGYSLCTSLSLVSKSFNNKVSCDLLIEDIIDKLILEKSRASNGDYIKSKVVYLIGHVRYSTNGSYNILDNQPYQTSTDGKNIGICFNGNIENCYGNNSECKYMLSQSSDFEDGLLDLSISIKDDVKGAFSTLLYNENSVIAFKDNKGIRPLVYMQSENLHVISSETCPIYGLNSFSNKDVNSNEIYVFEINECASSKKIIEYKRNTCEKLCAFELVYFSNEDSEIKCGYISDYRFKLGELLAKKEWLRLSDDDIITYIPESSKSHAKGYCQTIGKKANSFIKKSFDYERSFIKNIDDIDSTIEKKFVIDYCNLKGKRVILVDDSIVRGKTISYIASELRKHGVKEVHVRIASPMIKNECKFGVNTKDKELICKDSNSKEICEKLNVDSVVFLEEYESILIEKNEFCTKCFF